VFLIGAAGASTTLLGLAIASAGLGIIGGQNGGHAVTAGFYPPAIRSTGVGWALGIGRIGSISGPVLGGLLLARGTAVEQVFWAAAIPALIATMAAAAIASTQTHQPVGRA
jgi:MFS transporter, AAHS family, 4-hydroxybenzoate transporter